MKLQILKGIITWVVVILSLGECQIFSAQTTSTSQAKVISSLGNTAKTTKKAVALKQKSSYGQLPIYFEKNQGQTDSHVQFLARGAGYSMFLTPGEAVFLLKEADTAGPKVSGRGRRPVAKTKSPQSNKSAVLRMKLSNANVGSVYEGSDQLPGVVNYLLGKNPANWKKGIPTFASVKVAGVYPGVDMVYHGNQHQMEYDFIVNPGGDPTKIAFKFDGATGVSISSEGHLTMNSPTGTLTVRKPTVYQVENGQQRPVDGKFSRRGADEVGIDLGMYDRTKPLVIDPILDYSTYVGGTGDDELNGVAVDAQGYTFLTGATSSPNFPMEGTSLSPGPNGTYVGFVSKLNPTGTGLVYSTYFGGTNDDWPASIAIDTNDQAYLTGITSSTDFPTTTNAYQTTYGAGAVHNAFLAKLSADGQSLLYSSFLGGNTEDDGYSIAVDSSQNAFLTGYTTSSNFPVTSSNALQATLNSPNGNAFVARIDTNQAGSSSLIYSTFLGGTSSQTMLNVYGGDAGWGIAVGSNENAYVVGYASSTDFPVTDSAYQTMGNINDSVFLARIDTTKSGLSSLVYSTFLGGTSSSGDLGSAVTLDGQGNAYITGDAWSPDFPITVTGPNSSNGKAFVVKFNTNLSGSSSLIFSARVGGSTGEDPYALVVDPDGNSYVGGITDSTDFPVTSGAIQTTLQASGDGFLAVLSPDGSNLLYGTYLGGSGSWALVTGLALDLHENLYIAGITYTTNFPTTPGAFQTTLKGSANGFVTELTGTVPGPEISGVAPSSGSTGTTVAITGGNFGTAGTVTFNGTSANTTQWTGTSITAIVPPGLQPSTVGIVVNSASLASNSISFDVTQSLFLTPSQLTLAVGNAQPIQVFDENGTVVSSAVLTLDNSSIAEILPPANTRDMSSIQGDAPGVATLTARSGNRSGLAKITIIPAGASYPIGGVVWEVPSLGSGGISKTVQAVHVDDNTPDLYVQDDGAFSGNGALRALTASGLQKWLWRPAGSDNSAFLAAADNQGGLLYFATMDTPNQFQSYCYFGRLDENGVETWQYQETNCREDYAIHPDGTIFLVEDSFQNTNADYVTALDPGTGQIKFSIPAPGSSFGRGAISVSSDGNVYLPFATDLDVQLMVIHADGTYSSQQLDSTPSAEGIGRAISDGSGGTLITVSSPPTLYHVSSSGTSKFALPIAPARLFDPFLDQGPMLVGPGTVSIVGASDPSSGVNDTVLTLDSSSFSMKWSTSSSLPPSLRTVDSDGSVVFQSGTHTKIANPSGQTSPFFANLTDGSDAGPSASAFADPVYFRSGNWTLTLTDGGLAIVQGGPIATIPTQWCAQSGCNVQSQHAVAHHTFGLFWCGVGVSLQGYVPGSPCVQGNNDDIQWGYYPKDSGISAIKSFADHLDWVGVIQNEAIHSFQKTYAQYGIDVTYATFHGGSAFSGYAQIPDQEFVAYVVGDYPFPGSGKTIRLSPTSVVYYFALMEGAQEALGQPSDPNTGSGWINFSPSYPPQDPIAFQNMLHALGKGIGNAAAHEMGHHLEDIGAPSNNIFPNMDCGAGNDQGNTAPPVPCENGDNFVYAFYKSSGLPQYGGTSSGGMFFYGVPGGTPGIPLQPAIHWGPSDDCWLRKYTGLSCGGQ